MLRPRINEALTKAIKAKEKRAVSTLRLIVAAVKDRDIAARGKGVMDGIGDDEIMSLLQTMIRQRHDSVALYEQGGRLDLAEGEREEVEIIRRFLPEQMDEGSMRAAVSAVIADIDAKGIKDMGRTMAALRSRYAGRMDFAKASGMVKKVLA
ncbi:MAG: GatB/YqeY domain-containing protein [Inquilinus sp.]|nr:GatB/YqeY domain-containing protein [Inquilinus sp.]